MDTWREAGGIGIGVGVGGEANSSETGRTWQPRQRGRKDRRWETTGEELESGRQFYSSSLHPASTVARDGGPRSAPLLLLSSRCMIRTRR